MSWWVVERETNIKDTGLTAVIVQAASRAAAGAKGSGVVTAGPFPTKAKAQASLDGQKTQPGSDISPSGGIDLPDPLSGIERVGAVIEGVSKALLDGSMWRSAGWLLLGLVLIVAGLALWLKKSAGPVGDLAAAAAL
jgi:hypothetical protein